MTDPVEGEHSLETDLRAVIAAGDPEQAPEAMVNLGRVLEDECRLAEAEAAFRMAMETGHERHAWWARAELGRMLRHELRGDEAVTLLQEAAASAASDVAGMALGNLGVLLSDQRRPEEAEARRQPDPTNRAHCRRHGATPRVSTSAEPTS